MAFLIFPRGLKTTYGRVSRYGAMPRCWTLDVVGPITRSAEDCALILQAIVGRDGNHGIAIALRSNEAF